jgi:AAA+ ATPase superfamily predicted ATPase
MFIGRKQEIRDLNAFWGRDHGVLITCRGRRRIGKSTLIAEFASQSAQTFFSIVGLAPRKGMTDARQRRHFCEKVAELGERKYRPADTWSKAFRQLDALLEDRGRTVVLLDEISWMGGYDPDFAGYFKEAWDEYLHKHANLIFVLCGSVSSWIAENILNSTGFVGRDSFDIELGELSLPDSITLFGPTGTRLSTAEKLDLLSLTGGVPKYLEEIRPELSVDENFRRLCFLPRSLLFREFDETFSRIFGLRVATRGRILRMLVDGRRSVSELANLEKRAINGSYTEALSDLCYAGFVAEESGMNPLTGNTVKESRYRLKDNYVRFYLKNIEPRAAAIKAGLFEFASLEQLNGWDSILGLQFENLILNHVNDLFPHLGLEQSLVLSAAPYTQNATKRNEACQIDLLIRTERTLMVVEIKRQREIRHEVMDEVAEKIRKLRYDKKLSVRTALVYDGHLSASIPADRYFDFIVPAEVLLAQR